MIKRATFITNDQPCQSSGLCAALLVSHNKNVNAKKWDIQDTATQRSCTQLSVHVYEPSLELMLHLILISSSPGHFCYAVHFYVRSSCSTLTVISPILIFFLSLSLIKMFQITIFLIDFFLCPQYLHSNKIVTKSVRFFSVFESLSSAYHAYILLTFI